MTDIEKGQIEQSAGGPGAAARLRPPSRPTRLVTALSALIESHFRENWPVRRYAQALHVSAAHLRWSCVKVAGAPPVRLVRQFVIRAAKERLTHSRLSVSTIAHELGFEDPTYFARLFRKECGVSPTDFRRDTRRATVLEDNEQ